MSAWHDEPATERQKEYLRRLVMEADGEVDEEWLESLTKRQASRFIDEYRGLTRGPAADPDQQRITDRLEEWKHRRSARRG